MEFILKLLKHKNQGANIFSETGNVSNSYVQIDPREKFALKVHNKSENTKRWKYTCSMIAAIFSPLAIIYTIKFL